MVSGIGVLQGNAKEIVDRLRPQRHQQATVPMDALATIRAALAGWAGMTGLIYLGRRAGITHMDVMDMEGSLVAPPHSASAEAIGFVIHLGMSLGIGYIYALGFSKLRWYPSWKTGLLGSLIHWLIAASVVAGASRIHPRRGQTPMPGFSGIAQGPGTALAFLAGHVTYGTVFGWQYGQAVERTLRR